MHSLGVGGTQRAMVQAESLCPASVLETNSCAFVGVWMMLGCGKLTVYGVSQILPSTKFMPNRKILPIYVK